MFINLVNTDIPFAEYNLSKDWLDALKFRILLSQEYLTAHDFLEQPDSYAGEDYRIYLMPLQDKLIFLIVGIEAAQRQGLPLFKFLEVKDGDSYEWSDREMIDFLVEAYTQNPKTALIENYPLPQDHQYICDVTNTLFDDMEYYVSIQRYVDQEPDGNPIIHHYDEDTLAELRRSSWQLTPEEENYVEELVRIVLKKIYNYDYQPQQ